eukprot:ANDGO_03702.mRNA.1 hypothetical protein GUITHDRAFT_77545
MWDAVLVLGGGLLDDGNVPPWVANRLDYAAALFQAGRTSRLIVLSAGTTHKAPILDASQRPILESIAEAKYLVDKHHVNPRIIFCEKNSYDTIGNAYYCRMLFTDPFQWRKLHIVTSAFHMARSKAIFDWIFSLTDSAGNSRSGGMYEVTYQQVPDVGLPQDTLESRKEREARSAENVLMNLSKSITNLQLLHTWINLDHAAYSTEKLVESLASAAEVKVTDPALRSY